MTGFSDLVKRNGRGKHRAAQAEAPPKPTALTPDKLAREALADLADYVETEMGGAASPFAGSTLAFCRSLYDQRVMDNQVKSWGFTDAGLVADAAWRNLEILKNRNPYSGALGRDVASPRRECNKALGRVIETLQGCIERDFGEELRRVREARCR